MKKPTTADVAKLAGVSRATVSYVLNNVKGKTISEETREKIKQAVKTLDYTPNFFAKGLRTSSSKTVALILPSITDPTMPIMVKGVENATNFNEYSLLIHDNENIGKSKLEAIEALCEKAVDGVIYAYPDDSEDEEAIRHLIAVRNIPTVVIGKKFKSHQVSTVSFDHFGAGEMLADYLHSLGHRRIAMVITGPMTLTRKLRIEGLGSALQRHDLACEIIVAGNAPESTSMFFDTREYEMGFITAVEMAEKGLRHTALIGTNILVAAGLLNALKSKGVAVPADVSVASFGGHFISQLVDPKLTYVDQPFYEFGKTAFEVLKTTLEHKNRDRVQEIVYKPQMVVNGSAGRV